MYWIVFGSVKLRKKASFRWDNRTCMLLTFPENIYSLISWTQLMREYINYVYICEHSLFFGGVWCETKAGISSVFALQAISFLGETSHHSHFAIMWLVCSIECKQTSNTKGKESGSNVSSRFFGGAMRDTPKNGCGGDYWCGVGCHEWIFVRLFLLSCHVRLPEHFLWCTVAQ